MLAGVSLLTLLCLLGALQGVLLAVAVGSLGGDDRRSNRLLGAICLGGAAALTLILASHRWDAGGRPGPGTSLPELLEYSLWAFSGPVLLLYVSVVAAGGRWPRESFALHFLPGGVLIGYFLVTLAGGASPRLPPVEWMMLFQLAYTVQALRHYRRARSGSGLPTAHRLWVTCLIVVVFVQHAAQLVRWLLPDEAALRDIVPVAVAASFVAFTLIGLRRALPLLGPPRRRYAGSTLSPERAEVVAQRLRELMDRDRPHLRPELSLEELASGLDVPRTHLSQVLNERLGQTFLDFLASYRIRESERLLLDATASHLTIEAVGRDSGFRSRSAFYEAFRKARGMTPAEYRRRASRG